MFFQPLKNTTTILSSHATQKQAPGHVWPVDHNWQTLADITFFPNQTDPMNTDFLPTLALVSTSHSFYLTQSSKPLILDQGNNLSSL